MCPAHAWVGQELRRSAGGKSNTTTIFTSQAVVVETQPRQSCEVPELLGYSSCTSTAREHATD